MCVFVFSVSQNHYRATLTPLRFLIRLLLQLIYCDDDDDEDDDDDDADDGDDDDVMGKENSDSFYGSLHTMRDIRTLVVLTRNLLLFRFIVWTKIVLQLYILLCLYTCKCLSKIRTLFENQCTDCNVYRLQRE